MIQWAMDQLGYSSVLDRDNGSGAMINHGGTVNYPPVRSRSTRLQPIPYECRITRQR